MAAPAPAGAGSVAKEKRRKEIYTYEAPWPLFGLASSQHPSFPFRFAVGSFVEEYSNKVHIIQLDDEKGEFAVTATFDHPYPTTKILWAPEAAAKEKDLLATTGDYLRLWRMSSEDVKLECLLNNVSADRDGRRRGWASGGHAACCWGTLPRAAAMRRHASIRQAQSHHPARLPNHLSSPVPHARGVAAQNKNSEYCAPLTSFDWNTLDPSLVGTSSIDTTCTIWDLNVRKVRTQLIAHDKEVYDIAWTRHRDIFATVGADGSLRMFDLRSLEHSTIMYETPAATPLLRLTWNRQDNNYCATFMQVRPLACCASARMLCLCSRASLTPLHGRVLSPNHHPSPPPSQRDTAPRAGCAEDGGVGHPHAVRAGG